MTAAAAEALELALWLYRAPAHRSALLGRPLPDGVGHLLRIATGAEDALAAGSRITGEPAPVVLEAVRFYLQQVLFHEDADAYRVLGLRRDASQAQAREHHRLLQHWLHPDRRGNDDWETVFAGRVNRAWTQLRRPEARRAYDDALGQTGGSPVGMPEEAPVPLRVPRMRWQSTGLERQAARGRNLAIGVLVGCLGLLALIAMRPEAPPEWVEATPPPEPPVAQAGGEHPAESVPTLSLLRNAFDPPARVEIASAAPAARTARTAPVTTAAPTRRVADAKAPAREVMAPVVHPPAVQPVVISALVRSTPAVRDPVVAAAPIATAAVVAPQPVPIADPLARMAQAQDRARQVMAYLGDSTARQPPVWNDMHTATAVRAIRDALHARQLAPGQLRLELESAQWRLSSTGARLESEYRASRERGRLDIDFVWREEQLLVTAVSLVPAS